LKQIESLSWTRVPWSLNKPDSWFSNSGALLLAVFFWYHHHRVSANRLSSSLVPRFRPLFSVSSKPSLNQKAMLRRKLCKQITEAKIRAHSNRSEQGWRGRRGLQLVSSLRSPHRGLLSRYALSLSLSLSLSLNDNDNVDSTYVLGFSSLSHPDGSQCWYR